MNKAKLYSRLMWVPGFFWLYFNPHVSVSNTTSQVHGMYAGIQMGVYFVLFPIMLFYTISWLCGM